MVIMIVLCVYIVWVGTRGRVYLVPDFTELLQKQQASVDFVDLCVCESDDSVTGGSLL